jgi:Ni,Fe-hydrogenase III small subunit/ferredoxin
MLTALLYAAKQRFTTGKVAFPDLPDDMKGLPRFSQEPCLGVGCSVCVETCPTGAIVVSDAEVQLDRGLCITCGVCMVSCPSKTIVADLSMKTAVLRREDLVLSNVRSAPSEQPALRTSLFRRSVEVRVVSTGCSATDAEVNASANPDFDCSRFGIKFVASPRFADVLLVTGPVPKAMQEPLLRCYEAMAEPRIVVAAGVSAISGGVHRGGYAEANGVEPHLKVDAFIPGCPPHPLSITYGILLATRPGFK